jgi:5-methylcytosine-specific restriction endonuclease McrA
VSISCETRIGACVACGVPVEGPIDNEWNVCDKHVLFAKKEQQRIKNARKAARKRGLPDGLTLPQWMVTLRFFRYKCAYCGDDFQNIDHINPIWAGGATTWGNCIPSCYHCNQLKNDKDITRVYRSFDIMNTIKIAEFQVCIINALLSVYS